MNHLYKKFVDLVNNTKLALNKLIKNGTLALIEITHYLGEYLGVRQLTNTTDISELFEVLWPYYSYLDIDVLELIIKHFHIEEELQGEMRIYRQHLVEFKQSTTLYNFKNAVEEALIPTPKVVIKVNRQWGKKSLENLKTLVNYMFPHRMTRIHVEEE